MTTPAAAASWQVRRSVVGSPAWNPHATFALVTAAIMAASSPRVHLPKDSPTSLFTSIAGTLDVVIGSSNTGESCDSGLADRRCRPGWESVVEQPWHILSDCSTILGFYVR